MKPEISMINRTIFLPLLILLAIATVSCKKNESVTPVISIITSVSVLEGTDSQNKAIIPVTLSSASDKQVSFSYSTSDNTALAGEDYMAANASVVVFNPGETLKILRL